jgi:hypothetical protein
MATVLPAPAVGSDVDDVVAAALVVPTGEYVVVGATYDVVFW